MLNVVNGFSFSIFVHRFHMGMMRRNMIWGAEKHLMINLGLTNDVVVQLLFNMYFTWMEEESYFPNKACKQWFTFFVHIVWGLSYDVALVFSLSKYVNGITIIKSMEVTICSTCIGIAYETVSTKEFVCASPIDHWMAWPLCRCQFGHLTLVARKILKKKPNSLRSIEHVEWILNEWGKCRKMLSFFEAIHVVIYCTRRIGGQILQSQLSRQIWNEKAID